jgi:hypothetical protein
MECAAMRAVVFAVFSVVSVLAALYFAFNKQKRFSDEINL